MKLFELKFSIDDINLVCAENFDTLKEWYTDYCGENPEKWDEWVSEGLECSELERDNDDYYFIDRGKMFLGSFWIGISPPWEPFIVGGTTESMYYCLESKEVSCIKTPLNKFKKKVYPFTKGESYLLKQFDCGGFLVKNDDGNYNYFHEKPLFLN